MDKKVSVLIADEMTRAVRQHQAASRLGGPIEISGNATTPKELLAETAELQPDVVVVSEPFIGVDLAFVVPELLAIKPDLRIIELCADPEVAAQRRGTLGSYAFLDALAPAKDVVAAIAQAAGVTLPAAPSKEQRLAAASARADAATVAALTAQPVVAPSPPPPASAPAPPPPLPPPPKTVAAPVATRADWDMSALRAEQVARSDEMPEPPPPRPNALARIWSSIARRRRGVVLIVACYLSGLVAVNLVTAPFFADSLLGVVAAHVFPRVVVGNQLDVASIEREWQLIQQNYVYTNVSGDKGTQGAEAGIVTQLQSLFKLDRFTAFLTKAEYAAFNQTLNNGRKGSIGVELEARCGGTLQCPAGQPADTFILTDVLLGKPADRAGIRNGDVLISIDGQSVQSLPGPATTQLEEISNRIRGAAGTTVTLEIERGDTAEPIAVTRQDLTIPSVYVKDFANVLYMQVSGFDTDTGDLAKKLLQQNMNSGITGIVLDLRGNGGGYVAAAQSLASEFLTPGPNEKDVVVRRGRMDSNGNVDTAQTVVHDAIAANGLATKPKLVVLVDGDTASAAEIVTLALHDYGRATLVGVKTFGKGSVQTDFELPDGNDIHLTVEKWYGPKGENIDGVGIAPDITVTLANPDSRFRIDTQPTDPLKDAQFQAALAALRS